MASEKAPTALRTIGEVANDVGVATHVLRFWESKFNQIKPQKRRGRRYYRPEDVQTIAQIKDLLYISGYTIRGVQKYLANAATGKPSANDDTKPTFAEKQREPEMPNAPKSVNKDLFGNPIDVTGQIIQQQLETQKKEEAATEAPTPKKAEKKLNDDELSDLLDIYDGLLDARKKLKDIENIS